MKTNHRLISDFRYVVFGTVASLLAGCTVYQDQPRTDYYPQPSGAVQASVTDTSGDVVIQSDADFVAPLTPYGTWQVMGSSGQCWVPNQVSAGWQPYSNGYWESTDDGWYWVSSEPWGWATYHYGRWDSSPQYGWYWVPQTQWSPAWVSWRQGGGYVGWAPLSSQARFSGGAYVEVNPGIMAPRFMFVQENRFTQPMRQNTVIVNNTVIINKTVNITKTRTVNKTVINAGPRTEVIEQASGHKIQTVTARDVRRKQEAPVVSQHQAPVRSSGQVAAPGTAPARDVQPRINNDADHQIDRQKAATQAEADKRARQVEQQKANDAKVEEQKRQTQLNEQNAAARTATENQARQVRDAQQKENDAKAAEQNRSRQEKATESETQRVKPPVQTEEARPQAQHPIGSRESNEAKPEQQEKRVKPEKAESEKGSQNSGKEERQQKNEDQQTPAAAPGR